MLRTVVVVVLVVLLGAIIYFVFAIIPSGEKEVLKKLQKAGIHLEDHWLEYHDSLKIHYKVLGDISLPKVVLVHGSPGDWSAWVNLYLDSALCSGHCLIGVDRAGYGGTTVPALTSLSDQADVVWQVVAELSPGSPIIIVGHSYGGAVVEQLLLDHPYAFDKGILVAPTLSPKLMSPRWYNKFAAIRIINRLIPRDLRHSNIEMIGLPAGLRQNEPRLDEIQVPITYIQGGKDMLVPYQTVDYFKKYKPEGVTYVLVDSMNHFTPWSHPQLIIDAINSSASSIGKLKSVE